VLLPIIRGPSGKALPRAPSSSCSPNGITESLPSLRAAAESRFRRGHRTYELPDLRITRTRTSVHADSRQRGQFPLSRIAIASIEIRRPLGKATLAGAERAGGGSGMWRA
jgi:hypothetical protein